jgi:hypothetical protein
MESIMGSLRMPNRRAKTRFVSPGQLELDLWGVIGIEIPAAKPIRIERERTAILRAAMTAFIDSKRQVSLDDLCNEFQLEQAAALNHLRALKGQKRAHRAVPMTFYDCAAGQIWAAGPRKALATIGDPEPIQVTTRTWRPERIAAGLLESLFFAQGVPA